jgi:hypothetical protein
MKIYQLNYIKEKHNLNSINELSLSAELYCKTKYNFSQLYFIPYMTKNFIVAQKINPLDKIKSELYYNLNISSLLSESAKDDSYVIYNYFDYKFGGADLRYIDCFASIISFDDLVRYSKLIHFT